MREKWRVEVETRRIEYFRIKEGNDGAHDQITIIERDIEEIKIKEERLIIEKGNLNCGKKGCSLYVKIREHRLIIEEYER